MASISKISRISPSILRQIQGHHKLFSTGILSSLGTQQRYLQHNQSAGKNPLLPTKVNATSADKTTASSRLLSTVPSPQSPSSFIYFKNDFARQHHETRLVPFSPSQLYNVVSDVDSYSLFVPWCTSSDVTKRVDDSHMIADLSVGFRLLSDKYTSVITLEPNHKVSVDVPNSSLFDYLITDWTFEPHYSDPKKTHLSFYVEFAFRNPLYRRITNLFFEEVVRQMVGAFETQCFKKYSQISDQQAHNTDTFKQNHHTDDEHLTSAANRAGIFHRW